MSHQQRSAAENNLAAGDGALFPLHRATGTKLRVATYNVHKCRGLDNRVRPERIIDVLRELNADVVALQEVLSLPSGTPRDDQARFLAEELDLHYALGETRKLYGGAYGNLILSRFPIRTALQYDLSVEARERRGCLRVDLQLEPGRLLHIFNVHLGTAYLERRRQARRLTRTEVLSGPGIAGPRIVLGDFNEWTRGLTTRLLTTHFTAADTRRFLRRSRTYPGLFPVLNLDHIYFDPVLQMESLALHRTRTALIASDHLPLVGDFHLHGG
jgi:endonuclease/exonuclease/phosphatase family metal-dependent hydrolase